MFGREIAAVDNDFPPGFRPEFLGSSIKAARIVSEIPSADFRAVSQGLVKFFAANLPRSGKLTIGISAYGFRNVSPRDVGKVGLILKSKLRGRDGSVRLIPNETAALSSAVVLHNSLAKNNPNKREIIIATDGAKTFIAETFYVQDIDAYTFRDRSRPKRDAFVGMLPPKLAQTIVNLAATSRDPLSARLFSTGKASASELRDDGHERAFAKSAVSEVATKPTKDGSHGSRIGELRQPDTSVAKSGMTHGRVLLDPFCGTGVILQEAALMGFDVFGTDLNPKMIDYTRENLDWLRKTHRIDFSQKIEIGDATNHAWNPKPDFVACETYLGQPFSHQPSTDKLRENIGNCNVIVTKFLRNLAGQITPETGICIAVPAWFVGGKPHSLPCLQELSQIGFDEIHFSQTPLIYHRPEQIVGRQILVLRKI